jgi:hypothetical protein
MNHRRLRQALAAALASMLFLGIPGLSGCNSGDTPEEGKLDMSNATLPGSSMKGKAGKNAPKSLKDRPAPSE